RFSTGQHKNTQIAAECLRDFPDLFGLHLELLSRAIVELLREKAVRASHIADARNANVEKHRRKTPSAHHAGVSLEDLFSCKIHFYLDFRSPLKQQTQILNLPCGDPFSQTI